jgi:hypothetical protein
MDIDTLCNDAKDRLARTGLDELTDQMFRFRLTSAKRLWGFVKEGCFYVVWWDPEHDVFPTEPR